MSLVKNPSLAPMFAGAAGDALWLPDGLRSHLTVTIGRWILNSMVQYPPTDLDASFAALADGTRRGVLEELGRAEASITRLAERFEMTLTGMRKHVAVLEDAGLVVTQKVGRVRYCRVGVRRLDEVAAWIDTYQRLWNERFRELDQVLEEMKQKEQLDGHHPDNRGRSSENYHRGADLRP